MGKLIDGDELREAFRHDIMGGLNWDRILREAKTVDAVPVVHGRWIPCRPLGDGTPEGYMCSACHVGGWEKTNFCPHCGARMDGDDNGKT